MTINPIIFENANTGIPNLMEDDYTLDWSMTRNERYCLTQLLKKIKPTVTIEIGTYNGGSLQVLSKYSQKVYAIDIDDNIKNKLQGQFDNVVFLIGDSKTIIPKLIKELQEKNELVEFVLIDGDHSELGVKADIENIIGYIPNTSLNIILHDSFNPYCRKGMKAVNYNANPHIHYVELDYISGSFEPDGLKNEMWGGFAHIVLLKELRKTQLRIHQSQKKLYDIAYIHSKYFIKDRFRFLKPIVRLLRK